MTVQNVFKHCVEAIRRGVLIERVSDTDKEFHFQNWFKARLEEMGQNFEIGGRNSYPDFCMVATTDGYELKGLAYPGRDASFDSNSQVPAGFHNGRTIHYVLVGIDAFEAMMMREDRKKGFFVSFDYTSDAMTEISRFFKQSGRVIVALTVDEILNDQIAMKLA